MWQSDAVHQVFETRLSAENVKPRVGSKVDQRVHMLGVSFFEIRESALFLSQPHINQGELVGRDMGCWERPRFCESRKVEVEGVDIG